MRPLWIAAVALAALTLTGCGAKEQSSAASGAGIVPATAPAFVAVDTDLQSPQWRQVDELLASFPGKPELLQMLRSSVREESKLDYERDIKPALGSELDVAWVDTENNGMNVVGLTKPKDEEAFRRMITKGSQPDRMFFGTVGGWLVFSDTQDKVDRFRAAAEEGGKLADQKAYKDALAELPDETLVHAYVSGQELTDVFKKLAAGTPGLSKQTLGQQLEFIAAGLAAEDEGLRLVFTVGGERALEDQAKSFESELVQEVPADALAFVSFKGSDVSSGFRQRGRAAPQAMRALEQVLGFRLDSLLGLLSDEVAFYVRPQRPIPEFTLLFKVPNEGTGLAQIREVMDGLAKAANARTGRDSQAGIPLRSVDFEEGFVVRYGAFDGKVIVTTGGTAVDDVRSHETKLPDDDEYRDALGAAGAPDESGAFVYVNLKRTVALFRLLAKAEGEPVSDEVWANLAPLRSFVGWGEVDGRTSTVTMFLQIDRSE